MSVETTVKFDGEPTYLNGYVPSSLDSQHSSLMRTATWVGMGLILASLAGFGTFVFGLATMISGTQELGREYMIGGIIAALVALFGGFFAVHLGRSNYRAYVKRTGRIH